MKKKVTKKLIKKPQDEITSIPVAKELAGETPERCLSTLTDSTITSFTFKPLSNGRIMSGKAIINKGRSEIIFSENAPRARRNKQVHRTEHLSLLVNDEGRFSGTFHFHCTEKFVREALVAEIRDCFSIAENFFKTQKS